MKKQKIRFRVRYGFESTANFKVEAGPDLERVLYAWLEQVPVTLADRMVHGKHIIAIEPDYNFYTGWYESYKPTSGEDWKQIARDCPDFDGYLAAYKNRVLGYIQNGQIRKIGTEPLLILEKS